MGFQFSLARHNVLDTSGQERFRSVTTAYFRGARAIIVVYDVTDQNSLARIHERMQEIKIHGSKNTAVILVGNKST